MLDIKLLGTGGMMPLPNRYLTSLLVKYNGKSILVDCGDATQLALRQAEESSAHIDVICITHFHADHISGLVALMLLMGNQGKTSDLTLIGPKGLQRVVESMRVIAPVLPFNIKYIEIEQSDEIVYTFDDLSIKAFKVNHKITCYGYAFELKRKRQFDLERAQKLNIDKRYWKVLQQGLEFTIGDKTYTPDMVLGAERKGIKLIYCTDTRPTESLVRNSHKADLLICEGMYGDNDKFSDALEKRHMLFYEAAKVAKEADVSELWLTHFSPSMNKPKEYLTITKEVFENTVIPKDGYTKTMYFRK